MYQAKGKGGNSLHFYSQQMFDAFQDRLALESDLKQALLQRQFTLHLQPKIRLSDRHLQGLEVLLRWHSPARGMVPPDDFDIITSTIAMVRKLGLEVVAEGVETQAQCKTLIQHQCDIGQGYLFSKPIPALGLTAKLLENLDDHGRWR